MRNILIRNIKLQILIQRGFLHHNVDSIRNKVNQELFNKYIHYLENRCQVNGSFYKKIKHTDNHTGLNLIHEKTVEWVKTLGVHAIRFSCGFLLNDLLSLPIGLV